MIPTSSQNRPIITTAKLEVVEQAADQRRQDAARTAQPDRVVAGQADRAFLRTGFAPPAPGHRDEQQHAAEADLVHEVQPQVGDAQEVGARHRRVDLEADSQRIAGDGLGEHPILVEAHLGTGVLRREDGRQAFLQRRVAEHQDHHQADPEQQQAAGVGHLAQGHPEQHHRQAEHRPAGTGEEDRGGAEDRHGEAQAAPPALVGDPVAERQGQQQG